MDINTHNSTINSYNNMNIVDNNSDGEGVDDDMVNTINCTDKMISIDQVDYAVVANNNNNYYDNNKQLQQQKSQIKPNPAKPMKKDEKQNSRLSIFNFNKKYTNNLSTDLTNTTNEQQQQSQQQQSQQQQQQQSTIPTKHTKFVKSASIARLFGNTYNAKKLQKQQQQQIQQQQQQNQQQHDNDNDKNDDMKITTNFNKFNTYGGRRRPRANAPLLERFKHYAKEDSDVASLNQSANHGGITLISDSRLSESDLNTKGQIITTFNNYNNVQQQQQHDDYLGAKAFRTISRGLGKLWFKRTHSVDISTPDPEFKVSYLGNVLTGWAKGEGCVEKQLNTLWRNYTQNNKPDVMMRIKVCASGLKATTRQHGLTEYWANRITHCCAPKNYPRVFCWIYRHEGRKLKHELRCHAVLCSKERIVHDICNTLKENLETALREFRREKILRQNARLSLANAVYDNPSLPRRKILLSVGGNNYRPPLERSKSAPKLMSIEEAIGEEEGEEMEETNEPEMKSCCQKDSLYPAMTLGRRHCRRGHSIRRTGKIKPFILQNMEKHEHKHIGGCCATTASNNFIQNTKEIPQTVTELNEDDGQQQQQQQEQQRNSYGSDESDDFDKLLKYNNYDSNSSLANEILPYFDMQLHKNTSYSLGSLSELKDDVEEPLSLSPVINTDPSADPIADFKPNRCSNNDDDNHLDDDDDVAVVGLRRNGVCSDGEEDYLDNDIYFRQATILDILHRQSIRKMANMTINSDENSSIETYSSQQPQLPYMHQLQSSISSNGSTTSTNLSSTHDNCNNAGQRNNKQLQQDSDEGSISSGCETASTATANQDDISLRYRQPKSINNDDSIAIINMLEEIDATQQLKEYGVLNEVDETPVTVEEIYQRLESRLQRRQNSDATTFSSSSSITLKLNPSSRTSSVNAGLDTTISDVNLTATVRTKRIRKQSSQREHCNVSVSDSECSDESGYVEYQERNKQSAVKMNIDNGCVQQQIQIKPQIPPKPMPRRFINTNITLPLVPTTTTTAV